MKKQKFLACLISGALLVPTFAFAGDVTEPAKDAAPTAVVAPKEEVKKEEVKKEEPQKEVKVAKEVLFTIGSKEIKVDGVAQNLDVAPIVKNNRTFIPLRALSEAFGAKVSFTEAAGDQPASVTIQGAKKVILNIGKTEYKVGEETKKIDAAAFLDGSRTMVPLRFIGEALGYEFKVSQNAAGLTDTILVSLVPATDEKVAKEDPKTETVVGDTFEAPVADEDPAADDTP